MDHRCNEAVDIACPVLVVVILPNVYLVKSTTLLKMSNNYKVLQLEVKMLLLRVSDNKNSYYCCCYWCLCCAIVSGIFLTPNYHTRHNKTRVTSYRKTPHWTANPQIIHNNLECVSKEYAYSYLSTNSFRFFLINRLNSRQPYFNSISYNQCLAKWRLNISTVYGPCARPVGPLPKKNTCVF